MSEARNLRPVVVGEVAGLSFQKRSDHDAPVIVDGVQAVTPPRGLAVGAAAAAAAGVISLLQVTKAWHLLGYVLSSLITISLVAAFRRSDMNRRRSGYYSPNPAVTRTAVVAAVLGCVAAGVHAWYLARLL